MECSHSVRVSKSLISSGGSPESRCVCSVRAREVRAIGDLHRAVPQSCLIAEGIRSEGDFDTFKPQAFCKRGHDLSATRHVNPSGQSFCKICSAEWHRDNREQDLVVKKALYQSKPGAYWQRNLKNKYGLTVAEYERMLAEQSGVCAVCKGPETRAGFVLGVDHDHATGEVRGLLCTKCNTALGLLDDDPERIRLLSEYIQTYSKVLKQIKLVST